MSTSLLHQFYLKLFVDDMMQVPGGFLQRDLWSGQTRVWRKS